MPMTLCCMQIKGGHVTLVQLAEEWLLKSCRILQMPYSSDTFANALKEAEQFLWAGSEMDPVSFIFLADFSQRYTYLVFL